MIDNHKHIWEPSLEHGFLECRGCYALRPPDGMDWNLRPIRQGIESEEGKMRVTREQMFMQIAEVVARRSTCFRRSVGAILVHSNNIVAIGYNGAPPGEEHCSGKTCPGDMGCMRAIHAEINALHRVDETLRHLVLYATESPCVACASIIIDRKSIDKVFFVNEYRIRTGIELMLREGIKVFRMTPGGYTINCADGELV